MGSVAHLASLEPGGALARVLGGYENRPSQRSMASAVGDALEHARPLLVEAGTGTGKTLAYLIPAAASGKRIIISTGTRALQEQLATKDVELLRQVVGHVRVAVLKGVSNYVCRRRLADESMRLPLAGDTGDLDAVVAWVGRTDTGDRAELSGVGEATPIWRRITTGSDGRLAGQCPYIDRCFVATARRRAEQAELIIVNHHLFFTDLALRRRHPGARVLPDYDAVIFDEAHQLEDVIATQLGPSVSARGIGALVADLRRDDRGWTQPRILDWLEDAADRFFAAVEAAIASSDANHSRIDIPEHLFGRDVIGEAWLRLDAALDDVARAARDLSDMAVSDGDVDKGAAHLAASRRGDGFRDALADIAEPVSPPCGQWIEREENSRGGTSLRLCAAPASAASVIADIIDETPAAVFTSATLTIENSFDFIRERLGLTPERADAVALESPFDYREQALLYVPRDLPEPSDPLAAQACLERTLELLELATGGAFLLFTSWRALESAARELPRRTERLVLRQGQAPKAALLEQFREDGNAVLLGTASFWQGVDVAGDALSLVVIDKLPFAVPSDPLHRARCQELEGRGIDPFEGYQLPAAALQLKQGFGRLIRRRSDRGVVAILDPRTVSRRYGRAFLDSLPPELPRTSVLEQVRRFWSRVCS